VNSVRKAAIEQMKEIAGIFGPQWTSERLLPKIVELYSDSPGYTNRVTALQTLPQFMNLSSYDMTLSLLQRALKDSVANVRFCACKMIVQLLKGPDGTKVRSLINDKLKGMLSELESDRDVDVKYFAVQAVKNCEGAKTRSPVRRGSLAKADDGHNVDSDAQLSSCP